MTEPARPKYLKHIPGLEGTYEDGGAQMVRICPGRMLPKGDPNKFYMLRVFGGQGHEIWDVTDPANPTLLTRLMGLKDTHKNWWECDTGIAFLVSGAEGWRVRRMTQVYDLSDPTKPVKIRDFGLPGQEPGATGTVPTELHGESDRATGQSGLFRLRHQQGRRPADRRPRKIAEWSEGADAGQSSLSGGRASRNDAAETGRTPCFRCCAWRCRSSQTTRQDRRAISS